MPSRPFKNLTPQEQWERDRPAIHALKNKAIAVNHGMTEDDYRNIILDISRGRCDSSKALSPQERQILKDRLRELAGEEVRPARAWNKKKFPGRPKNMDKGQPDQSRADQLEKIEALLTIGKLPWKYADSIARQMRLADKIQWVKTEKLHYVITALTKKAQKEGWDLSGAR